jgi:hypothetical protein
MISRASTTVILDNDAREKWENEFAGDRVHFAP